MDRNYILLIAYGVMLLAAIGFILPVEWTLRKLIDLSATKPSWKKLIRKQHDSVK